MLKRIATYKDILKVYNSSGCVIQNESNSRHLRLLQVTSSESVLEYVSTGTMLSQPVPTLGSGTAN